MPRLGKHATPFIALAALAAAVLPATATQGAGAGSGADASGDRAAHEVRSIYTSEFGVRRPTGVRTDQRTLVVTGKSADGGSKVVRISPGEKERGTKIRSGSARHGTDRTARNPEDGLRYTADADAETLRATDAAGRTVATYDLSGVGIADLQGMAFGPTTDRSDAADAQSLFVADAGDSTTLGRIAEVSLAEPAAVEALAMAETATLVATRDTSAWSPSSPDPSGITYNETTDRLEISDGEVDEMPIYAGANLYTSTRQGGLTGTATTVPWSNEPTDLAYNPATGQRYYTDDDKKSLFVQAAGGGTPTSFKTSTFGLTDPEGVAYDAVHNMLWMSDGVNADVYGLQPGPNGTFNGVPPAGDDIVAAQFDISKYGSIEAEGIEYDDVRDTLIVLDDTNTVLELDRNGSLLTTIDINAADPVKNAGVTIAPASDGSGDRHYYLVDRGLDNNSHPGENDGLMYEMSADLAPITNRPPAVNAGADQMIDLPETANLMGTAIDDGQPAGVLLYQWTAISGPGTVTFGSPLAANTTATFSATGQYVLRLTANDGGLTGFDDVIVDVYPVGGVRMVQIPISHGADDAMEFIGGTADRFVDLSSADNELGNDGPATPETVLTALRFTGIPVPQGGEIVSAKIQFKTDELGSDAASFLVRGEAADNAAQYVGGRSGNIRARVPTTATAQWSPPAWSLIGEAGVNQQTPELKAMLQEIVDRPGWAQGNAAAFMIDGTGRRTAEAKDGLTPPVLLLQFRLQPGATNVAPTVNAGTDATVTMPNAASLDGTVTDDGLPGPTTTAWSEVSGPGNVTFGNAAAVDTTATFSASGTYVLRLTANDGALQTTDEVSVQVNVGQVNLTLQANPTSVRFLSQTTLSGSLRTTPGNLAVGGEQVQVWVRRGGVASLLRTVTTASNGTFSFKDRPLVSSTYWAVHPANARYGEARSADVDVTVRLLLTAQLSDARVQSGEQSLVRGDVGPVTSGMPIRLQRWNGQSWILAQELTRAAIADGTRAYQFPVQWAQPGTHRYRVVVPAHPGWAAATMPTTTQGLTLTVR